MYSLNSATISATTLQYRTLSCTNYYTFLLYGRTISRILFFFTQLNQVIKNSQTSTSPAHGRIGGNKNTVKRKIRYRFQDFHLSCIKNTGQEYRTYGFLFPQKHFPTQPGVCVGDTLWLRFAFNLSLNFNVHQHKNRLN